MWGLTMPNPVGFYWMSSGIVSGFQTKNNWSDSNLERITLALVSKLNITEEKPEVEDQLRGYDNNPSKT